MSYQSVFKRYEIKYLVTDEQKKMIMQEMQKYMYADKYGKRTISNRLQTVIMPTNTAKAQFATYILTHLIFY